MATRPHLTPLTPLTRLGALCPIALVASALFALPSSAQLSVERVYFHINKPIAVRVSIPAGVVTQPPAPRPDSDAPPAERAPSDENPRALASGTALDTRPIIEIELLRPREPGAAGLPGDLVARAPALEGTIDLSTMFPVLWQTREPQVLLAQLSVNAERIGPPLVLQPMTTPKRATAANQRGLAVTFAPAGPDYFTGLRVYADRRVLMQTSKGPLEIALRPDAAPNSAWNFHQLVEGGYYTGTLFHRVIATTPSGDAFMAQAGDPLGTGVGGPGYAIALEPSTLKHALGTVSMARLTQPDTAGGQFFVALSRGATASLDGAYCAFAQVIGDESAATLRAIASTRVDPKDKPVEAITIERAWLSDAPPVGGGNKPIMPPPAPDARAR